MALSFERRLEVETLAAQGLKRCTHCNEVKSTDSFSKKRRKSDGLDSWCKTCVQDYHREYRSNPEKRLREVESHRAWLANHRQHCHDYNKNWSEKNPFRKKMAKRRWHLAHKESENAKALPRMLQWAKDNPERHNEHGRKHRALKAKAIGSHTLEQWNHLVSFFDRCPRCGEKAWLTLDHIIPLNKGGSNDISNCQPLCKRCNSAKQDLEISDYRPAHIRAWAFLESLPWQGDEM